MAEETTYEVNAKLTLSGKFETQMARAARSIDPVQRKMLRLSRTVQRFGRNMQGASLQMGRFAKMGAAVGGAAAGGGMLAMITAGFRFNKVQEDTIQNLATMNAFYKVGNRYIKDASDKAALFATNVGIAGTMWEELLVRQQETPAGVNQLAQLTQSAMAGIAQVNRPLDKQLDLITQLSMLGPALANDYKQLGADTMRILTGGAGQDVLTFRLMRNELFDLVKASGKLGKSIQNNDKFVKEFNTKLNETQKFDFMVQAMETLGPRFKKMFSESMSGLASASKSKMSQISGAFTNPMYLGFRNFLKRANMDKGGLLTPESLQKFMGIAAYFGDVAGNVFNDFLSKFENVMGKLRDSWSSATDAFLTMWSTAITMLKIAIVAVLGRKAAGMFVGAVGKSMELFTKAKGAITDARGSEKGLRGLLPKMLGFASLAVAAIFIGTIVAAMSAYIIQNWKKIVDSILDNWRLVEAGIIKVWVAAKQLWNGLAILGEAVLGTSEGSVMAVDALSMVEAMLRGLGKVVLFVASTMNVLMKVIGGLEVITASFLSEMGQFANMMGMWDTGQSLMQVSEAFRMAADDSVATIQTLDNVIYKLDEALKRPADERTLGEAKEKADALLKWIKDYRAGKNKIPTSGVNIANQYNQWDLRNTDPDRIMSAFVPKLEAMADQRTQSYEALDQGL